MKFKTNIKCSGCIATVSPYLNEKVGKENWQVDIQDPNKVLTINSETPASEIISTLEKAGYTGELVL